MVRVYSVLVLHDAGIVIIKTFASSMRGARQNVMGWEHCPASAILCVERTKSKAFHTRYPGADKYAWRSA